MQSDSQSTQRFLRSRVPRFSSPKKQYCAIPSQKRSSKRRKDFDIYSDTPDFGLQEIQTPAPVSQKLIFQGAIIPKTSFSDSQATLVPTASQTPLQSISGNIQSDVRILSMLRKPDLKVSFTKGKNWEKKQPNDHTSMYVFLLSYF